jgi:large subunit ribosomal protein L24
LAIAIILALTTALVGPLFVDWSRYRSEFETRASQLTGVDFHITGTIDARLLPTPTLVLHGIEMGQPTELGHLRVRALRIEFGLGALARGEWRITDARLEGPEIAIGMNEAGRLEWSPPKAGFDPEGVSIERLRVQDGRAILSDAASGSRLVLEKVEFRGDLRSLSGPIKGDGSFMVAGQHVPYRLSATRIDEDGGTKLRLALDPIDRPLTAEAEISISFERGTPRFEGNLQLARPVGRAPVGSQSPIIEPWRLSSRVKGDSAAAVLEQIEFQYGPDERATKLRGTAHLRFGREPRINAALSSPQIDLDRMLSPSEAIRQRPLAAGKLLAEDIARSLRLPLPMLLSVTVESLNLGGAVLQRLTAELEADGDDLNIRTLDFRAPGVTQVHLGGKLTTAGSGIGLKGSGNVESNDPRALLAWLSDRGEGQPITPGGMRLAGELSLSPEAMVVEHLNLDFERMNVAGQFAYTWGTGDRPTRLDAALSTPDIDLDRLYTLAQGLLGDSKFTWPTQGTVALKIGRASLLGVQARQGEVNLRLDGSGLAIDPLTIAEFGGAALAVRGRIDTKSASPRGAITLDLDARALDGILAIAEKVAPDAAQRLRNSAARVTPILLRASLTMDPGSASNLLANAKVKADGRAGVFRLALLADASATSEAFKADMVAAAMSARINLIGRIDADDSGVLLEFGKLDRFLAVEKRPGQLALSAKGNLNGELEVDARLAAGPSEISTNGKLRISPAAERRAELDLKLKNVSLRSPRPVVADRPPDLLPASLTARLAMAGDAISLGDIKGRIAGAAVAGRLNIGIRQPMTIEGALELGNIDLTGAVATIAGVPVRGSATSADGVWPSEPFEQMLTPFNGQLTVNATRVALTPKLEARDFKATAHFGESQFALQATEAALAGGRARGELILLREREGLIARARFAVTGANAAELLPGDATISGRLAFEGAAEGTGMSPAALIGSLEGSGKFTLEGGRIARLDARAFEAVMRAVDQGLPIEVSRLRDRTDSALSSGALTLPRAEGAITISAGQARLSSAMSGERGSELAVNARLTLVESELDARLVLTPAADLSSPPSPEITVMLKGPVSAPRRTVDVAPFASWLALRAVEQQSKKLDVLEGRVPPAPPTPPSAAAAERPSGTPAGVPGPNRTQSDVPTATTAPAAPEAARPRPPVRNVQRPKPPESGQSAPPLDLIPRLFGVQ